MTTSTAVSPDGRRSDIRALTGLRAVVATWVVLFHFAFLLFPYLSQVPMAIPIVNAGWTGVEFFFVLSGFVITLACLDRLGGRARPAAVYHFLVARLARVWPAWAVVTVLMAAWLWGARRAGVAADVAAPHPAADPLTLLRQLSMTQMWGEHQLLGASYLLPGWSVSAEWAAYLAFPLLAVALRPMRRLPAPVLLGAGVVAMLPLAVIAFTTGPLNSDQHWELRISCGFTAGALCALGVQRLRTSAVVEQVALRVLWTCVGLIPAGALWASWRVAAGGQGHDYTGVVVVLFPLVIVALALTERGPARLLASGPLVYGGRISYSLYLVHFMVFDVTMTIAWQDLDRVGVLSPGLALAAPLLVVLCFLLAAGLHHGVEEPARSLVLRLSRVSLRRIRLVVLPPVPAAVPPAAEAPRLHPLVSALQPEDLAPLPLPLPVPRTGPGAPRPVPAARAGLVPEARSGHGRENVVARV